MSTLHEKLAAYPTDVLGGIRRGIEKEGLRVQPSGDLALTPHPTALGSALTHPSITTDYSESQIELVTGAHLGVQQCLDELTEIHQFALRALRAQGDETLWVSSMPCRLPTDETIPLARYGSSNVGRAKSIYRMGLGHRYGRRMQTICGIHYNWSMPGVTSEQYFSLIRNFRRNAFVLLYLFGASPALCPCFAQGRPHALQRLSDQALYLPHATSLRMGRLGYQSDAQATLAVSYNGLQGYADSLHEALTKPYPAYEAVGIRNPGGDYNQLGTSLLQIENEFYGTIRPKRVIQPGERPLHALRERGVEYVEVRLMDLNPFLPVGIDAPTMRLLDVFLLYCLLTDSPPDTPQEIAALKRNQHLTAARGREPGLELERDGRAVLLTDWAQELLAQLAPIAQAMDRVDGATRYADALARAQGAFKAFDELPSARVLRRVREQHQGSVIDFVRACSQRSRGELLALPYPAAIKQRFDALAAASWAEQKRIEASDHVDFETFRRAYVSPDRLAPGAQANMDSEAAI